MKYMNIARRFGAKVAVATVGVAASAGAFAASDDVFGTISSGVDLSTVTTWLGTIGVTICAIALGMKGISLVKRAINKA